MAYLKSDFFVRILQNTRYLPRAVSMLRDWLPFTRDYLAVGLGRPRPLRAYTLRNGSTLQMQSPVNMMTLGEIFLRRDYGTIKPYSIVIDVGAHIGLFAVYAATTAPGTTVYAYEPMPANLKRLQDHITRNGLTSRIIPHAAALSGVRGCRRLYTHPTDVQHSLHDTLQRDTSGFIEVECVTLQDVFDRHGIRQCDVLKMDCEGAEYESLYSTPPDYLKRINALRMEYHRGVPDTAHGPSSPEHLVSFLEQQGFHITRFEDMDSWLGILWADRMDGPPHRADQ